MLRWAYLSPHFCSRPPCRHDYFSIASVRGGPRVLFLLSTEIPSGNLIEFSSRAPRTLLSSGNRTK